MDSKSFIELINRYLANQCNAEETLRIDEWYRNHDERENFTDLLTPERKELLRQKMLSAIHARLDNIEEDSSDRQSPVIDLRPRRKIFPRVWLRGAAALIISVAGAWACYEYWARPTKKYETAYGERNTISLPDGSSVTLNGHSTLRSNSNWSTAQAREVWLDGEAFFSVRRQKNNQKFLVHTSDGLTIEVLGTSFNVKKRGLETQVVLKEGSIRLSVPNGSLMDTLTMKPGDLVEITGKAKKRIRAVVQTEQYTSWQNLKMTFRNTSLREILKMMQEVYGYEALITDETLMDMRFSGSVPNDNIDILLQALQETLSCKIELKDNQLTISKK